MTFSKFFEPSKIKQELVPIQQPEFNKLLAILLEQNPSVFKTTPYGDTQGMQLVQTKQFSEALEQLKAGTIIPKKDLCRFTFTMMAQLVKADLNTIKEFMTIDIIHGNNVDSRCANGQWPLYMMAANLVSLENLQYFLSISDIKGKWQSNVGYLNRTIAHAVCLPSIQTKGPNKPSLDAYQEMITYLQSQGVRFDVKDACGLTATDYAQLFHSELVAIIDPDYSGRPLPDKDDILDFWGLTSVQYAVLLGSLETLKQLFNKQASFTANSTMQTPLHSLCCFHDDVEMAQYLIETVESQNKYAMNQPDTNGFYPVHNACAFGRPNLVNYLLTVKYNEKSYASQINTLTDSQGRTLAHDVCMNGAATQENSITITNTLIQLQADFMKQDKYGIPAIIYAYVCRPYLVNTILKSLNPAFLIDGENTVPSIEKLMREIPELDVPINKEFLLDAYLKIANTHNVANRDEENNESYRCIIC